MDSFLKIYKEYCKDEFEKYGFKRCKNNHYRVVNDVLQTFLLHRSIYGYNCTVEFGITPLCYGIDKDHKCSVGGIYNLRMFEGGVEWWEYPRGVKNGNVAKLNEYIKNPDAFNNKGILKNAPSPETR